VLRQVFENTPAWKEGTLQAGDELVAVNGRSLKGMTKVQAAKFIQRIDVSLICFIRGVSFLVSFSKPF
jgi:C-terminal processing protease CtpA/Prc